ncbi:MAG TPA: acetyl-CoA acetyltransferase [Deltaproteobacteria bacterium]|nr:acetyl-CoA acetyltransferase [Deltaproteobacteria bacterium]HQI00946.1 acetyl-CoA acetyltransferase [Deltaproteobacteria bacterium]
MSKPRTPIIAGIAQYTQPRDAVKPLDPVGLMERVCRQAFLDAGAGGIKDLVDHLIVVNLFQWRYRDAPGMLSGMLGMHPKKKTYSSLGGNVPQLSLNRACTDLASGAAKAVLITGAEAIHSIRRSRRHEIVLDWPENELPEYVDAEEIDGVSELENAYDLYMPSTMYALIETAIRAASGRSPEEHRHHMARIWERLSKVAAENPHAWVRRPVSAEEIAGVTPDNRYICYPYTKYMNANINVDQAAAVLLTTADTAEDLGIEKEKWVYPLGGAYLIDIRHVSRRPRLDASPALRNASKIALKRAGLHLEDIDFFDLYSCFPSAVEIAVKEIGLAENDPRPISVTGGLTFFGGPGNNYCLHAIASAAERIRQDRSQKGMVTANGWYVTKHSVGIYGGEPPDRPWQCGNDPAIQEAIDAEALPGLTVEADGTLTVEAYVIRHGRNGEPESGTVLGRLEDGSRCLAHVAADMQGLCRMEECEMVGRKGAVHFSPEKGLNLMKF